MKYYRGTRKCGFRQFSYFTKHPREAQFYGDVCAYEIKPRKPLRARDLWEAGLKTGVLSDFAVLKTVTEKQLMKIRRDIHQSVGERGFDALDMGNWIVVSDARIVRVLGETGQKHTPPQ